jgi:two-component system LytT family response regulator
MITCLAIDDEPLALEQLKIYIGKIPFLELVGACQSALEASKMLAEKKVDAIFIDINMPDLNGLAFVQTLVNPPLVVFTTAYSEYAVEGYKVDAVDYLLKPFGIDDFQRAANKVLRQYNAAHGNITADTLEEDDVIYLKADYRMVKVTISKIRYVEGMSEYLRIYLDGEKKPVIVLLSMKKIEERLPSDTFMRVHRSYIVNLKKIEAVSRNRILMDEDTYIPIGDNYKDDFFNYLNGKAITR